MKILHLQSELNLSCGITKSILLIMKNSSTDFHHQVIAFGGDGVSRFTGEGINPLLISNPRFILFRVIKTLFYLISYCKQNKIDIIHSHHRYFDFLAFLISRIVKVKTVMSVHSKVYKHRRFSYKSKILIAVSGALKNHLITEFFIDETRIKVINNFIDPNELLANNESSFCRNNIGLSDNNFVVTFIGRFSKEKGIDTLLKSISKIQLKYKKVFLLMIGEGEEKDQIENYIHANNLNARILQPAEKVFNYYKISDMIVLPSRTDPFPMVMLETGLNNKPFIGSKVDGIAEFIEDEKNGLLIEPENVDELVDAVIKILIDKTYASYIANNLSKKVLNQCQLNQVLPKLERIYTEIYNGI